MPGIGTAITRTGMMIKNKLVVLASRARNFLAHYKQTWLPYGAVLLLLAGVWYGWEGNPAQPQTTIRETKHSHDASSPVFSSSGTDAGKMKNGGTLVYSTAAARRKKPLDNLFSTLPKKGTEPQIVQSEMLSEDIPKNSKQISGEVRNQAARITEPVVCGIICADTENIVILRAGTITKTCRTGDTFAGWYVAYVNTRAVGLIGNEQIVEVNV